MGDESGTLEGKSLSNLRVVDLKMELEKRGLSKSGSKKELVKRLKQKLELEKLYEESSAIGESEPKLQLDEATEQNEFVKQYLAEQQKIYARQKEVRRLIELREKEESGGTDDSDSGLKDQDSDVSEGLSKSTCDSSAFVEGDGHDEKEQISEPQTSASEAMLAPVVESVSSNQENPCDSTNSPSQPMHGKTEPSFVSAEMDSQSKDAITFSLLDIKLPESPKRLSGMSGSKSPRNKADKLPQKDNSQQETDSVVSEKETSKTNGSVPKTSRSGSRWSDSKKTPSAESESTKHTEQKSALASKTATPTEKLEKENLSEEDVSLGNTDKETERQMHSSHKLESRAPLGDSEPVSSELVQQTDVFTEINRNENEKKIKESKFPEQVLEVSESSASKEKHRLKADDADMKKDSIDVSRVGKRSGSDSEIVDTSERSHQKMKQRGESPFKSEKLKRRSSSSSGSSASSRSSSPEVRNNTNKRTKLSRRPEKRANRSLEEKVSRSPKSKYGHGLSTRWGQDQDAKQRKDPKARSKIDIDISRHRGPERNQSSSEASSSPRASRSRSPEASRSSGASRSRSRSPGASQGRSPEISQSSDLKASEISNVIVKQSQGPKCKQRPSPKHKRSASPGRKGSVSPKSKRSVSPKSKRSVSPKRKRSISPKRKRSVSPKSKRSVSPKRKRSISPKRKRSVSPKRKRSVSPKRKRSVSPKHKRSVSPKHKRSVSPKHKRSISPKHKRSVSPKRKRNVSPKHKGSLSSKHKCSASLIRKRSTSPIRKRSTSPIRKRSTSPIRKRSTSPIRKRSTSPIRKRSTSPIRKRSTSPIRKRSTSPIRKRSTSPICKRSTSPVCKRSTSPVCKRSTSLVCKRSTSPVRKRSASPVRMRDASPTRKSSTSPVCKRSTSPECRPSVSPKRKWSATPLKQKSPLPKDSISSTTMRKNRNKIIRSVSSERGQKLSPEQGQSLSPQREQSPVPRRRNRSSSSEDSQDENSEAIPDSKAKVESERSSCDSSSESSDSDQRESKRAISVRKDMLKAKQMLDKEASESVSEKKIEQVPRQPKRPKLNRNSFSDTMAQQMDLKKKEAASAIQRVKSVEEKALVASKDAMTTPGDKSLSETAVPPEIPPEKISYRKLNMPFKKNEDKDKNLGRKRRWRSSSNMLQNTVMNISSDSLKNLIPDFKLTHTPVTRKESEEIPPKIMKESYDLKDKEENGSAIASTNNEVIAPKVKVAEVVALKPTRADKTQASKTDEHLPLEDASKEKQIQARRRLEATPSCSAFANALKAFTSPKKSVKKAVPSPQEKEEDTARKDGDKNKLLVQHPEPPKPTSRIIFVQNLVRPFTLTQLKNLLNQTGKVVEESFWIDKIKSKCFVKYETEEEAIKTKEALHDARWPPSNPKILSVDFATQDEFDQHSRGYDVPMPPAALARQSEVSRKREELPTRDLTDLRKKRLERHSREKDHSKPSVTYVREWDKDKLTQESPERESVRPPKERPRSSERRKDSKRDSKKKSIEDTPAKLLDDLFQKTKSIPSIYWLPLTEEQVKQREDERRQRRLDRERRNQEEREAERRTKRKPREKQPRSRSRSRQRQDRRR